MNDTKKYSPRTRGWSPSHEPEQSLEEVFPAHAGVVPTRSPSFKPISGIPRARGGGPCAAIAFPSDGLSSPCMRGWSHNHVGLTGHVIVFPAHARYFSLVSPKSAFQGRYSSAHHILTPLG